MAKLPMIILYVSNQKRSVEFYKKILKKDALLDVSGMAEFELAPGVLLGLMPEKGIAKIISPPSPLPESGNGIPRCELYLIVDEPSQMLKEAVKAGALHISDASIRDWGDTVAYCADPDGHIIAFAK